jgi:hypothetical protein
VAPGGDPGRTATRPQLRATQRGCIWSWAPCRRAAHAGTTGVESSISGRFRSGDRRRARDRRHERVSARGRQKCAVTLLWRPRRSLRCVTSRVRGAASPAGPLSRARRPCSPRCRASGAGMDGAMMPPPPRRPTQAVDTGAGGASDNAAFATAPPETNGSAKSVPSYEAPVRGVHPRRCVVWTREDGARARRCEPGQAVLCACTHR